MTRDQPPDAQGGAFYDQPGVLDRYARHRRSGVSSPNLVMEAPAVTAAVGDVIGARVLDLGCGDGAFGGWLLDRGAASYLGVDASAQMVRAAAADLARPGARVRHAAIETFDAEPEAFDLVVSRLALHYVDDVRSVFARCRRWLAPGGRLLVTVLHPVITSHDARATSDELRTAWVVDDYFDAGPRPQRWMGGSVTFHHRTIEQYVTALVDAGFRLTALRECEPDRSAFDGDEAEYRRRRRIPMFLLLLAQ